jgi:hypothetical protein
MYGISDRLQRQFDKCQREYEAKTPPEWDTPDYADTCEDGECGECQSCVEEAAEYTAELAAEAEYERRRDRRMGL